MVYGRNFYKYRAYLNACQRTDEEDQYQSQLSEEVPPFIYLILQVMQKYVLCNRMHISFLVLNYKIPPQKISIQQNLQIIKTRGQKEAHSCTETNWLRLHGACRFSPSLCVFLLEVLLSSYKVKYINFIVKKVKKENQRFNYIKHTKNRVSHDYDQSTRGDPQSSESVIAVATRFNLFLSSSGGDEMLSTKKLYNDQRVQK